MGNEQGHVIPGMANPGSRGKADRITIGGIPDEKGRILGKDRRRKGPMRPV